MVAIHEICALAPVIPVITVAKVDHAGDLARALVAGGLPVLEVTLRTAVALEAIREMRAACPEAVVGAGTLRSPAEVTACLDAGAAFGVSPGAPSLLMAEVVRQGLPFLPGCATATEAMTLAESGYEVLKFFPAGAAGGPTFLESLASPLPDVSFCPTGGVTLENAPHYLRLPNVRVVGGSWVAPVEMIERGDWSGIESLAREAVHRLKRVSSPDQPQPPS